MTQTSETVFLSILHFILDEVDVINSDSDEMSCEGYGGMVVTTSQFSLTESL